MRRRSLLIAAAVGVPISLLFLWLALRDVEYADVWATLLDASPGLLLAALAAMALVYVLQAERWRCIASQPRDRRPLFAELVVSGVAVNNVLPGRVGDLLRARWLGLDVSIPGGRAFATVVVDRGFDLAALVTLLLVSLPFVTDEPWLDRIVVGGVIGLLALACVLAFARFYTRTRSRERRTHRSLLRRVVRDTVEGLAVPLRAPLVVRATALSFLAWAAWGLSAWLVAQAVGVELSLLETAFVAAVMNLGVAIPSSPGFVGTYQWIAVQALGLFAVSPSVALGFALLVQAVWFVPTTLIGGTLVVRRLVRRIETVSPAVDLRSTG